VTDATLTMYDGITTTRAIRRFQYDVDIPEADLAKIFFAASRAPSGNNSQPFRFVVLRRTPEAMEARKLLGVAFRSRWRRKSADEGYSENSDSPAVPAPPTPRERLARAIDEFVENVERSPLIVLPCLVPPTGSMPGLPPSEIARGANIYPACQNILLAARSLGYGGAMTMWHRPAGDLLNSVLGIPPDVVIAATLVLGKPAGAHGPVRRRPLQDLVFENRWGEAATWAVDPPGTRFAGGAAKPAVVAAGA
jgi:nitroreductase